MFETANISEAASAEIVPQPPPSEESEKRDNHPLVPRIEDYPTKARVKVADAHRDSAPFFDKCERQTDSALLFIGALENEKQKGQEGVVKAAKPSPEMQKEVNGQVSRITREFALLSRVHAKLKKNQDASALLLKPSFITGESLLIPEQEEELERRQTPVFKLKQHLPFFKKSGDDYENKTALLTQDSIYQNRLHQCISETFKPIFAQVPDVKEIENVPLDQITGLSQSQVEAKAQAITRSFWEKAKEAASKNQKTALYKDRLFRWLDAQKQQLKDLQVDTTIGAERETVETDLKNQQKSFQHAVDNSINKPCEKILEDAFASLSPTLKAIRARYYPYVPGDASSFLIDTWIPREATERAAALNPKLNNLVDAGLKYNYTQALDFQVVHRVTAGFLERVASFSSKKNEEFGKGQELFWHTAPYDVMKTILTHGFLSSRKAQIKRFGESYFHSGGGIKTTKDQVITVDEYGYEKAVDKSQFQYNSALGRVKNPNQETHQVCFQTDSPYRYQDGVALVFSKASLCAKSQFLDQDGWHLFSQDYRDNEDSLGFEINLGEEPNMLIVVTDTRSADFIKFLKDNLGKTDEWITQNVIQVKARENGTMDVDAEQIRQRFFERHQIAIQRGLFVPTGEIGDHAGRGTDFLYTYKTAA